MPPAVILDYDPSWPVRAQRLLAEVRSALEVLDGSESFGYDHIGSTAVPGLGAKPIVDLQVRLPRLPTLDELAALLAESGFVPAGGARADSPGVHRDGPRPGHEVADPGPPELYEKRLFHAPAQHAVLHIRLAASPFAQFVVLFRDWLRAHPDQARRYERVKRALAERHANDPDYDDYTRAKRAYFTEIDPELRAWERVGR